jgi:hypothetical protein
MSYRPLNLLGAMWLQFAQAVGRGGVPVQCLVCSKLFVISDRPLPGVRRTRSDKKYCDDVCRMAAANDRKSKKRRDRKLADGKKKKKKKKK